MSGTADKNLELIISCQLLKLNDSDAVAPIKRRRFRQCVGTRDTRRSNKRRNRSDDIPDCLSLEVIDFESNNSVPAISSRQSMEKAKRPKKKKKKKNRSKRSSSSGTSGRSCRSKYVTCCQQPGYFSSNQASQDSEASPPTRSRTAHTISEGSADTGHRGSRSRFITMCLENLGSAIMELFFFLLETARGSNVQPSVAAVCIALLGTYLAVLYLEVSLAAIVQVPMEWAWPWVHVLLRASERFFLSISGFFRGLDDIAQSSYCDMAATWCQHFDLMCDQRCSFTKFALERIRG